MESDSSRLKDQLLEEKIIFPYATSSLLNDFFFGWVFKAINFYRRNRPIPSNLYSIPKSIDIGSNLKKLKKNWEIEKAKPQPKFLRAVMKTISKEYFIAVAILAFSQLQFISIALLSNSLIEYLTDPDRPEYEGIILLFALVINTILGACVRSNGNYRVSVLVGRVKNMIAIMISEKCLTLTDRTVSEQSTRGKMLNIISNDMEQLELAVFTASLWGVPLVILGSALTLWYTFGPVGLVGIGISFLHLPIIAILGKRALKFKAEANIIGDKRIKMIENLIAGIKIMKLYAWEFPILNTIYAKRQEEIGKLLRSTNLIGLSQLLGTAGMAVSICVAFLLQVSLGYTLTPGIAFLAILIFAAVHFNIVYLTVVGLSTILNFVAIMNRTGDILTLKEYSNQSTESKSSHSVSFTKASFSWRDEIKQDPKDTNQSLALPKVSLSQLSLHISPGELVIVVGSVGSGKSSLLMGILGELNLSSGEYSVQGTLAFASEEPWIVAGSIKENILMGRPYQAGLYAQTLNSCSLVKDLELLKDGEDTLVGDRGITLSGGQKSRISLARAVYSKADIVLLDDPLSAVDAEVANYIFQQCIKEQLAGQTVILATHQVQFLAQADKILVLDSGSISFYGSYEQLNQIDEMKKRLGDFAFSKDNIYDKEDLITKDCNVNNEVSAVEETEVVNEGVKAGSYIRYAKFGFKNVGILVIVILFNVFAQCVLQAQFYWASYWSSRSDQNAYYLRSVMGYLLLIGYFAIALRIFSFINLLLRSNIQLHNTALESVVKSPVVFFDSNPTGRILSRFSKDLGVADGPLQFSLFELVASTIIIFANVAVTFVVNPYTLILVPVVALMLGLLYSYVSLLINQLRGIELLARGPLLSSLNSAINGLPTLRCLNLQGKFRKDVKKQASHHHRAYLTLNTVVRFLQFYVEIIMSLIVFLNLSIIVAAKGFIDPALAAYSIATLAMVFGFVSNWNKYLLDTSTSMASVQRLLDYADLPSEGCLATAENFQIARGEIQFKDVCMRYRPNLPHSLSRLNLTIKAGHKVGIVGRTGAGKSSILQVLFRLVNPESGTILIDGHDYLGMGLHDLRKQMSVIPQSAILFTTTVRENLDPFLLHTDQELIDLLEEFKLKDAIFEHAQGLDAELNGEGISFSAGQKQLLCLARAVLRRNKIIMMDEATANVDNETDRIIQETVKEKFKGCTLLVIAHRMRTIIESNEIIVMDKGECREYDSPSELFKNENSLFRNLIQQSGLKESEHLISKFS